MKKLLMALMVALALPAGAETFVKGADVGWLPQMEATGYKFFNKQAEQDCLQILKDLGINTVRLRTWVNRPTTRPAAITARTKPSPWRCARRRWACAS
jgi:arabinogalactan endo-1,4-beta-galactosidase